MKSSPFSSPFWLEFASKCSKFSATACTGLIAIIGEVLLVIGSSLFAPPFSGKRWLGRRRISFLRSAPALGCREANGNTSSSKTTSLDM
jgi:hypothetical protein